MVATIIIGAIIANATSRASADQNINFNVNLNEVLTVSITNPTTWASGNTDELLRNKVTVTALTNNYHGATVSMYADDDKLYNTASYSSSDASTYIEKLDGNGYTYGTFPTNAWGYSITDSDAGTGEASYLTITTSTAPVTLLNSTIGNTGTKSVYFGAKASSAKQSGTYAQTVNFVAVTGVVDPTTNPQVPVDPSNDNPSTNIATYTPTTNRTTYTNRTRTTTGNTSSVTGDTSQTTTQVSYGNTQSSYANAAGVTTSANNNNSSALATALGVAAGVTAVSGTVFFVLAKRKKDDEDEE